jgi:hypothetical protein
VLVDGHEQLIPILLVFTLSLPTGQLPEEVEGYFSDVIPRFTSRGAIFHVVLLPDGVSTPTAPSPTSRGIFITQYVREIDRHAVEIMYSGFDLIGGRFRQRMDSTMKREPSPYALAAEVIVVGDEPTNLLSDMGVYGELHGNVNLRECRLSNYEEAATQACPRRLVVIFIIDSALYTAKPFIHSGLFFGIQRANDLSHTTGLVQLGDTLLLPVHTMFPYHALLRVGQTTTVENILAFIYRLIYNY